VGAMLGEEVFTDLDYADDVALLAEMLEVLILSLEVMQENWRRHDLLDWRSTGARPKSRPQLTPSPTVKRRWLATQWT
jgi:hypothetical protein